MPSRDTMGQTPSSRRCRQTVTLASRVIPSPLGEGTGGGRSGGAAGLPAFDRWQFLALGESYFDHFVAFLGSVSVAQRPFDVFAQGQFLPKDNVNVATMGRRGGHQVRQLAPG